MNDLTNWTINEKSPGFWDNGLTLNFRCNAFPDGPVTASFIAAKTTSDVVIVLAVE